LEIIFSKGTAIRHALFIFVTTALASTSIAESASANHYGYYHGKTWRDNKGTVRCYRADRTIGIIVPAPPPKKDAPAGEQPENKDRPRQYCR
jgi:hypothetical protein